ncbi:unnamed protein product [Gadus morhua 'NCC']
MNQEGSKTPQAFSGAPVHSLVSANVLMVSPGPEPQSLTLSLCTRSTTRERELLTAEAPTARGCLRRNFPKLQRDPEGLHHVLLPEV